MTFAGDIAGLLASNNMQTVELYFFIEWLTE
jgi:hypothetical protein